MLSNQRLMRSKALLVLLTRANIQRNEREEGENMCLAFEEWEKRAITKGVIEGKAEGKAEERRRIVVAKYAKGYSAMEIAEFLEIGLKEVEDIISAIRA